MRLAEALDLTFQQVQKYESGFNRIGVSRLYHLSLIFGVPVSDFFEGIEDKTSGWSPDDVMVKRESMQLVRAYDRIRDPKVLKALHAMTKAMAKGAGSP